MKDTEQTWNDRWQAFTRRHPAVHFLIVVALAVLTAPLMIAATSAATVLYKDF